MQPTIFDSSGNDLFATGGKEKILTTPVVSRGFVTLQTAQKDAYLSRWTASAS